MRITKLLIIFSITCIGLATGQPITFTGNVESDFTDAFTVTVADPFGADVGMPGVYPPGTISGNDIKDVRFYYDSSTDILYVGLNTYTIAGDVDSDGSRICMEGCEELVAAHGVRRVAPQKAVKKPIADVGAVVLIS